MDRVVFGEGSIEVSYADSDLGFKLHFSNRQPATSCRIGLVFKNGNSKIGARVGDRIGVR